MLDAPSLRDSPLPAAPVRARRQLILVASVALLSAWWGCGGDDGGGDMEVVAPVCMRQDCDDQMAPEIVSIEPKVCAQGPCPAPLDTPIEVRFSEPIDPALADGGRMDCTGALNVWQLGVEPRSCLPGEITLEGTNLTLWLAQPLLPNTRYAAHVSEQVRDLSGTPMRAPFRWEFDTQSPAVCGNGELSRDEVCDDGNALDGDYCAADCSAVTGACADGVLQPGAEECDDENEQPLDGCSRRCTLERVQPRVLPGDGGSCGLRRDGSLRCWGAPLSPAPEGLFEELAVAGDVGCALTLPQAGAARELVCWGGTSLRQAADFDGIVAGGRQVCGLRSDGGATCVALDGGPALSIPAGSYVKVAVEPGYACGIGAGGNLACVGQVPAALSGVGGVQGVAQGDGFTCVLESGGGVRCPGATEVGLSAPPSGPFVALDAAGDAVCGMTAGGEVVCWQRGGGAAIGPGATGFVDFGLGPEHGCGITERDEARCWSATGAEAAQIPDDFP